MKKILLISLAMLGLSACTSLYYQSVPTGPVEIKVENKRKVDIQVGEKVYGYSQGIVLLGLIKLNGDTVYADGVNYNIGSPISPFDPTADLKAAAAYKAVRSGSGDVLLAPIYTVEETDYFLWKKYRVNVKAYSGKIIGIQ